MQLARNIAVIALLALVVFAVPGGGAAADTVLTLITMSFLAGIGMMGMRLYRENRMTLWALSDGRRGILYGAFGAMGLMIAGADEMLATPTGTLAWVAVMVAAGLAVFRILAEGRRYS